MSRRDVEAERLIEVSELKEKVSCVVLLERLGAGWILDKAESTRNCLKYRCGAAVLIVNHGGRGWWDPHRAWDDKRGRGDVFTLVQGVVQIRVTPKARNPFTIKALSISGVTWKWRFLNHAGISSPGGVGAV